MARKAEVSNVTWKFLARRTAAIDSPTADSSSTSRMRPRVRGAARGSAAGAARGCGSAMGDAPGCSAWKMHTRSRPAFLAA